jgi:hypothetical protein
LLFDTEIADTDGFGLPARIYLFHFSPSLIERRALEGIKSGREHGFVRIYDFNYISTSKNTSLSGGDGHTVVFNGLGAMNEVQVDIFNVESFQALGEKNQNAATMMVSRV